jgi:hypothetical protein
MCVYFFISCRGYQNNISHGNEKKIKKSVAKVEGQELILELPLGSKSGEKINEVHDGIKKNQKGDSYGKYSSLQKDIFILLGG